MKLSIKAARVQKGVTQAQLATRLGVSVPKMAKIEREPDTAKYRQGKAIAAFLGVSVNDIDFYASGPAENPDDDSDGAA